MNSAGSAGVRSAWIVFLISFLTLALACAAGPAHAADAAGPSPASPALIDPNIRQGVLANGMRYLILRHAPAQHEVALRLRIDAGSLQEPDGQDGVAHLLEHMAFRGSTHVPESEIWKTLARLGMAFGADSNAFTTTRQTYFQFDLPDADGAAVDTGLMLMREIASELTLSPMAVNDERPVVLAEARLTDSPAAQADRAQAAFWFREQPALGHDAMGEVDVIGQIQGAQLRAFYDAYYRPERTTLLVVGDVDPPAIEAQIRARFADWRGRGNPGPEPVLATPKSEARTGLFVQPGAPASVRLAWLTAPDPEPRTAAAERRRRLAELAIRVLNRRLSAQAGGYLLAVASRQSREPLGDVTLLTVDAPPARWRSALTAAEHARRQALLYGFEPGEIRREAEEALRALEVGAAAADARPTAALANALVARLDEDRPLTSAAQDLALAKTVYANIEPAEIDRALAALFAGAGPFVFLSSPQQVADGEAGLAGAFAEAEAAAIAPPQRSLATAAPRWPYTDFGPRGVVAERHEIADLQTSFVRFQNGVRLTVRPSTLSGGQIQVQVAIGRGRLDLPRDRMSVDWAADSGVIDAGGLRAIDRADLHRALAASVYSFSFTTGDDSFNLSGVTRPADLDVQMQVLAAYATEPGWRVGAFEHVQTLFNALLPQFEASPSGVLGDYVGGLLHDGDPRWLTPTMGDVVSARPRDLRALLEGPLAAGPIEITVVGDVSVDRAIQAVAATFGALPPRPPAPEPRQGAYQTQFPAPTPTAVVRYHGGHADQALALIAWPAPDAYAPSPGLAALRVLQQVLNNRLIEQLRIADGATYTPRTGLEASRTFPDFGYLYAAASVAPGRTDLVFDRIRAITADLATNDISADELERARKPALAALERAEQTDAFWLTGLSRAQSDPRRLDLIRSALPGLRAVSIADLHTTARTLLRDDRAWKLVITPSARRTP